MFKRIYLAVAFCLEAVMAMNAQLAAELPGNDYSIDSSRIYNMYVGLENMNFIKDNEFSGSVMKGYTLPGLWLQPSVKYYPLSNVKLELGFRALIYDGAIKYPNLAYQDIAVWKGGQYQRGAHLLPMFRAQVQLSNVQLVWGTLYSGSNHGLMVPLYDPELDFSADPDLGFQVLVDSRRLHLDAWINWQSFVFRLDDHQEAFTVGLSMRTWLNPDNKKLKWYVPLQVLAQHRGGEIIDTDERQVRTLMNGALGVGAEWNVGRGLLRKFGAECAALGYYQQSGTLWPFDSGMGAYVNAYAGLGDYFNVKLGYFYGHKFISMYGLPYFGCVSTKNEGAVYDGMTTVFGSVEYRRPLGHGMTLGVWGDVYECHPGQMTSPDGTVSKGGSATNFAFGAYFKVDFDFHVWCSRKQ